MAWRRAGNLIGDSGIPFVRIEACLSAGLAPGPQRRRPSFGEAVLLCGVRCDTVNLQAVPVARRGLEG